MRASRILPVAAAAVLMIAAGIGFIRSGWIMPPRPLTEPSARAQDRFGDPDEIATKPGDSENDEGPSLPYAFPGCYMGHTGDGGICKYLPRTPRASITLYKRADRKSGAVGSVRSGQNLAEIEFFVSVSDIDAIQSIHVLPNARVKSPLDPARPAFLLSTALTDGHRCRLCAAVWQAGRVYWIAEDAGSGEGLPVTGRDLDFDLEPRETPEAEPENWLWVRAESPAIKGYAPVESFDWADSPGDVR